MAVSDLKPTLIARLAAAWTEHAARPLLVTPTRETGDGAGEAGVDRSLTGAELHAAVAAVAAGLRALGVRQGEPVLLWSENREPWLIADLALLALGAPVVPRGAEAPAAEIAYIIEKVRARVAIVERPELLARLTGLAHAIETVVLLTGAPPAEAGGLKVGTFEELQSSGRGDREVAARAAALAISIAERRSDDVAAIVFTSGTTGRPKGVVLTQGNLASNLEQVLAIIRFLPAGSTSLSILPPWHMFEQMVEYALLALGARTIYTDRRHLARDLAHFRPSVLAAVPRLWMALMEGVHTKLASAPPRQRALVLRALALAEQRARRRGFGGATAAPTWSERLQEPLLRRAVIGKLTKKLGVDRLRGGLAISGGGTLPDHVDLFFQALGIELLNGYGLTETSPVLTLRRPGDRRARIVGAPLAGTALAIRDPETGHAQQPGAQGVIHARGPQVMRGYFEDDAATAAVVSRDGWFDTGDLGFVGATGELSITGRAKDTIVLLSGENIEPEPIENALLASPLIAQAVVVGQDQKFLGALIVPRRHEGEPLRPRPELEPLLRREIDARVGSSSGFRPNERIARFALLDEPFSFENGLLSQTLKIKRAAIQTQLGPTIEALFRGAE